jgi:hypothetical protein
MSSRIVSATPTGLPGAAAYTYGYDPSDPEGAIGYNLLTIGEETFPRELCNSSSVGWSSGQLRPTFFTCRKTEMTSQVRVYSGSTAAAATPTLCRIGLWTTDTTTGELFELVAATANDTTLFAASATAYTRNWSTPYQKIAGQRYALGILQVTAGTVATFFGNGIAYASVLAPAPIMSSVSASGLSDLPASAGPSAGSGAGRIYAELLP